MLCYSVLVQTQSRLQKLLRDNLGVSFEHFAGNLNDPSLLEIIQPAINGTILDNNEAVTGKTDDTKNIVPVIYESDSVRA